MARPNSEKIAASVLELLERFGPLQESTLVDCTCALYPRQAAPFTIRNVLAELKTQRRLNFQSGVWSLVGAIQAAPPAGIDIPTRSTVSAGAERRRAPTGDPDSLTKLSPTVRVAPLAGDNQEQLWADFLRSLTAVPEPIPTNVTPELIIAAHEWSLATPLLIRSTEEFKAIPTLKIRPFLHQVKAAITFFSRLNPRGLIADDVGLGKTVTAGLILLELILRRKVQGFVIIAPKMIQEQWQRELREKFQIEASIAAGKELQQLQPGARIITTYHSAARHIAALEHARIDLVVFDEMHKLRNLHAPKPPKMAQAFHAAQKRRLFRYCLGLSATPLQNSLRDLFSLADVLRTPDPTPYGTLKQFEARYLADSTGRKLKPNAQEEFRRRTFEFMHRTSRRDSKLPFPEREVVVQSLLPSREEIQLLQDALQTIFGGKASVFERIGLAQTILSSPAAALAAIQRRYESRGSAGATELKALTQRFADLTETAKSKALVELLRQIRTRNPKWRVLIFTNRRATAEFIRKTLERDGLLDVLALIQGNQPRENEAAIQAFQADPPIRRVLVSTDAGAEGVNLQACNVLINFDLPWNPMVVEQRIGRIQRLGQKAAKVVVYNLVTKGTIEESVVSRLFEKLRLYDSAIGLAEEILGQLADDDEPFETVVLRLAEAAVLRGDAQAAIAQMERNAEEARRDLERQRAEMDATIGSTDVSSASPRVPEITRAKPSMTARDFWSAGMAASGWTLNGSDDGGLIEACKPGRRTRRFTFDPAHPERRAEVILGAHAVEFVAPDERPFEELVGAFAMVGLDATEKHLVDADSGVTPELLRLLSPRVLEVLSHSKLDRRLRLRVAPTARANVSVAHDQFEKLVQRREVEVETRIAPGAEPRAALSTADCVSAVGRSIREAIAGDRDVGAFRSFYEARRDEEVARIERSERERSLTSSAARALVADQRRRLTPLTEPRLVCIQGTAEEAVRLRLSLRLDNQATVEVDLELGAGEPIEQCLRRLSPTGEIPSVCDEGHWADRDSLHGCGGDGCARLGCRACADWKPCAECGETRCGAHGSSCADCHRGLCPRHALSTDDGRLCCRDCLGRCAASGTRTLKSELIECDDTHEIVRRDLAIRSAASGKWIRTSNAVRSDVSGLPASAGEFETCAVTGKRVLPSELVTTRPAQKRMLPDRAEKCADTNALFEPGALASCAICKARVAPERLAASGVSGSLAHPNELATCSVTRKRALPSEVGTSAVSGRTALNTLFVTCEDTGKRALPDEVANCGETGKRVLRSRLRASSKTKRLALAELTGECAACGNVLLNSEMTSCAVTGRLADPGCMEVSAISGAKALPSALATCGLTGRKVLPTELEPCAETQRLVASDRMGTCAFTGARVAQDKLLPSAYSGKPIRQSAAQLSNASGRVAGPGELVISPTGMKVLRDELEQCPECGKCAVLQPFARNERFECGSCAIICCKGDRADSGNCVLCEAALTGADPTQPTPEVLARAPKAKSWFAAEGATQTIWVGRPGKLRLFAKPVLIRAANSGEVLHERELR